MTLTQTLCWASAALREARRAHVRRYDVLMPHVFMADVLAQVGTLLADGAPSKELARILDVLEHGMIHGNHEVRSVIAVSFVSDAELEPFFAALRPQMGPLMRVHMRGA